MPEPVEPLHRSCCWSWTAWVGSSSRSDRPWRRRSCRGSAVHHLGRAQHDGVRLDVVGDGASAGGPWRGRVSSGARQRDHEHPPMVRRRCRRPDERAPPGLPAVPALFPAPPGRSRLSPAMTTPRPDSRLPISVTPSCTVGTRSLACDVGAGTGGGGERFVYAYYEGIDKVAHARGLGDYYDDELRDVDRLVGDLLGVLAPGAVLVVTADHGQVAVGSSVEVLGGDVMDGVTLLSGEGRFRWLHTRPGATGAVARAAREPSATSPGCARETRWSKRDAWVESLRPLSRRAWATSCWPPSRHRLPRPCRHGELRLWPAMAPSQPKRC